MPTDKAKNAVKSPSGNLAPKKRKPYEEIGAIFNGNEVRIRVPKSTCKPPKLTPSQLKLQQTCTCDDNESICSEGCGYPYEYDGGPDNRLNFRIPDDICESLTHRTPMNSELIYTKKEAHDKMCKLCNVTPQGAPKGVQAHKMLHPDKDVFLLKIGKQTDEPNRTGNIQVELITPRAPAKPQPPTHFCKQVQCDPEEARCCIPSQPCRPCGKRRPRRPSPKCCY